MRRGMSLTDKEIRRILWVVREGTPKWNNMTNQRLVLTLRVGGRKKKIKEAPEGGKLNDRGKLRAEASAGIFREYPLWRRKELRFPDLCWDQYL